MDSVLSRSCNSVQQTSPHKSATFGVRPEIDNFQIFDESFSPTIESDMFNAVSENDIQPKKKKRRMKLGTPWKPHEDAQLAEIIRQFQIEDDGSLSMNQRDVAAIWNSVAEQLPTGRTGKQCRDRWLKSLRPGLKKGGWSQVEEDLIMEMYTVFGPRWSAIAKLLPNRTDNDIKNKFYAMKRKDERTKTDCPPASLSASLATGKGGPGDLDISSSAPTDVVLDAPAQHPSNSNKKKSAVVHV